MWCTRGDGDLFAIGGNHLIHAARRNVDLKVVCINNLIYAMTGGQTAPTTPGDVITSTNPYGTYDPAFNLPYLVEAAGAVYVARWTAFHVKQLARSMQEMFAKKGFSFIEVLSPCPTLYQRRNKMGDGLDTMKFYKQVASGSRSGLQRTRRSRCCATSTTRCAKHSGRAGTASARLRRRAPATSPGAGGVVAALLLRWNAASSTWSTNRSWTSRSLGVVGFDSLVRWTHPSSA